MDSITQKITNSILEHTNDQEAAMEALIHWRWSQIERWRRNFIRREFKDLSITNTEEYSILVYISHNATPTASDITNYLTMEKSTVSEFIKRCLNRNLIIECPSEKDKRKKHYQLSKKGSTELLQAHERMESISKELFQSIDKKGKKIMLNYLVNLNENLIKQTN